MIPAEKTSITMSVTKNAPKTICTVSSWRSGAGMAVLRKRKASQKIQKSVDQRKIVSTATIERRNRASTSNSRSTVATSLARIRQKARASCWGETGVPAGMRPDNGPAGRPPARSESSSIPAVTGTSRDPVRMDGAGVGRAVVAVALRQLQKQVFERMLVIA